MTAFGSFSYSTWVFALAVLFSAISIGAQTTQSGKSETKPEIVSPLAACRKTLPTLIRG